MENESMRIEKLLEESQFATWKFQMTLNLKAIEAYDVVTGARVKPEEVDSTYAKWIKDDAKAQKYIGTTIAGKYVKHIVNLTTAKEMWEKLISVFDHQSDISTLTLGAKFFTLKKEPDENMITYISRVEEMAQRFDDMGEPIRPRMLIMRIISGLPETYAGFSSAWESASESDRTIDKLRTRLLAEEERMVARGETESAEALLTKRRSGGSGFRGKKPENGSRQEGSSSGKPRKSLKCFKCHKGGHFARECPGEKGDKTSGSREQSKREAGAFMCSSETGHKGDWILDTGATDHMTCRREWVRDFRSYSTARNIRTAGGGMLKATGCGSIDIMAFDGKQWKQRKMVDVLYVPDLECNLFSGSHATDGGYTLEQDSKACRLQDNGRTVAVGVRDGKLYKMKFKTLEGEAYATSASTDILRSWHERLGHQNLAYVKDFLKQNGIKFTEKDFTCEACLKGKLHRDSFGKSVDRGKECGDVVHVDVCGPMQTTSLGGSRYMLLLKDDFSRFRFVYLLKEKSEVVERLRAFIKQAEKADGHGIKRLRSDNGTEFVNAAVKRLLEENGIRHQRTVPYTPEQNGAAERENRTLIEAARTMLQAKEMKNEFWAEAVNTAVYVLNRTGKSSVIGKTPYELWFGSKPKVDHLRLFGSRAYIHVPKQNRRKLDAKSVECVFVGYDENVKGYRMWNADDRRIEISRDVRFIDDDYTEVVCIEKAPQEEKAVEKAEETERNDDNESEQSKSVESSDFEEDGPEEAVASSGGPIMNKGWCSVDKGNIMDDAARRNRGTKKPACCDGAGNHQCGMVMALAACYLDEPRDFEEAMKSPNKMKWKTAMDEEMGSLLENGTWKLVDKASAGHPRLVDNKWVYKVKYGADGDVERFKARLVARGFTQRHGVDYDETFSAVVKYTSVRLILSIAAAEGMQLCQFDVRTAFLYGELKENVYMSQPVGFDDGSGRICKLVKSLYGLKQASRCWNECFTAFIEDFGFRACESDSCIFIRERGGKRMLLAIYVDDGLIAATSESEIEPVIRHLSERFKVKQLDVEMFLGMEISRRDGGEIHLRQTAYAKKVLNRFGMQDCKAVSTPMDGNQMAGRFEDSQEDAGYPYREAVGSLMYLAICTRPDLRFAVGVASRYMEHPKNAHVNLVRRIMKYVSGTLEFGIYFGGRPGKGLTVYSDADYAGCTESRKSTSGAIYLYNDGPISWYSERQKCTAQSTAESEYIAASTTVKEIIWLKRLLMELAGVDEKVELLMDNQSAIRMTKNPEFHKQTKHIEVRYHFIREKYNEEVFEINYVPTDEQLADIFTKPLLKGKFEYFRGKINIVDMKQI